MFRKAFYLKRGLIQVFIEDQLRLGANLCTVKLPYNLGFEKHCLPRCMSSIDRGAT